MTVLRNNAMSNAGVSLNVLCTVTLLIAGIWFMARVAFAQDDVFVIQADTPHGASVEAAIESDGGSFSEGNQLKVGMPIEQAIKLLGGNPDSETEVGAACGELNILTWNEDGTRIISVDGTVTSIVEDGTSKR